MSWHEQSRRLAHVVGVNGNMVTGVSADSLVMGEVAYIVIEDEDRKRAAHKRLKAEIIRIRGVEFDVQVFEDTADIKAGHAIELTGELLSIELGPGLLGGVFDGLGNPLKQLAARDGHFLRRGSSLETIDKQLVFTFEPKARVGQVLSRGQSLGVVREGSFEHRIVVPFALLGKFVVIELADRASVNGESIIARLEHCESKACYDVTLSQRWPVKIPLAAYAKRLLPTKALSTKVRMVDAFSPIAEGGTACISGPFGSGKTVFQQGVSRHSDADVVIVAACGERAGEVVETLTQFPKLLDPTTGQSLMERTIIICNTSSMPVAAREASVYTAITMAEYYRHMGLRVLVLADSTSRWAQAMREMSGRLEEIPAEEAYPAYLGSLIAALYERAGVVRLEDPNLGPGIGSLTLIGTVSPAGGHFEEPVTQSTLSVVGCFLGLSNARSYAQRFPAITLDSWSKYLDTLAPALDERYFSGFVKLIKRLKKFYAEGQSLGDHMKMIGEEDMSLLEFVHFLKAEFFDAVFLQQNAFDDVDASPSAERVASLLKQVAAVIEADFSFKSKLEAKETMARLCSMFRDLNRTRRDSPAYDQLMVELRAHVPRSCQL